MTFLHTLKVRGIRNISRAELPQLSRINLFYGSNGAGKTSLLEALYLLGLGRSFRSNKQLPIIGHQEDAAIVYGEISPVFQDKESWRPSAISSTSVGIKKSRDGNNAIRIDGQPVSTASQLADIFPLQLINADTFQLLLGPPGVRRRFLDWGVFHVEHNFLDLWRRMQRTLKQRNSLLRRGKISASEMAPWDQEYSYLAEAITALRVEYFGRWLPELLSTAETLWPGGLVPEYTFYKGWDRRFTAGEMLQRQAIRDRELGYTSMGPHRADVRVQVNGLPAGEVLSRGQLKLLSIAMRLAQGSLLNRTANKRCVYLLDDLPAELDKVKQASVCKFLVEMNSQLFLTSVDQQGLDLSGADPCTVSMFHVEHGVVHQ